MSAIPDAKVLWSCVTMVAVKKIDMRYMRKTSVPLLLEERLF